MSALAELLKSQGHEVSGSDLKLEGHNAKNVNPEIDFVIRTSAVSPGSPGWVEVEAAEKLGIPVLKRSELLGQITDKYDLIAISGMHGKTTTTSLAGLSMIKGDLDPTVLIGEHIQEFNNSALRLGHSKYFVFEACEYDRSFLDFHPSVLILTNIDEEHLDTYPGGLPEIKEAFEQYVDKVRSGGTIIANAQDPHLREILENPPVGKKVIWYGTDRGKYSKLDYRLSIPGEHNRLNALAVLALADVYKIKSSAIKEVFSSFKGAKRRLEYWGELNNAMLYDDYGHHPTEIAATLDALKAEFPEHQLVAIFWPHQYRRIKPLLAQFAQAFQKADKVYIKKIYFVPGRDEMLDVSSGQLARQITDQGIPAIAFDENEEIIPQIIETSKNKSVLLTIGIPPIYELWQEILGE